MNGGPSYVTGLDLDFGGYLSQPSLNLLKDFENGQHHMDVNLGWLLFAHHSYTVM